MANNNSGSHRTGSSPSSRNNSGSRQRPGSYSERYNRPNPYSGYLPPGSAPSRQIYHPESVDPVRIKQLEREQEQARLHTYEDRVKMPHSNAASTANNHVQNQQSAQPPRSGNSRSTQEAARRGKQTRRSQVAQQHAARAGYAYRTPSSAIDEAHLNEIRQNAIDEAERLRSMPPEPAEIAAVTVSAPEQTPPPAPVPEPAPEPVAEVPVKNHTNSASFPVAGAAQFAAINNKKKKNKSSAAVAAVPILVDTTENSSTDDASSDAAVIPVIIPSAVEVITPDIPDAPDVSVPSDSPVESETPEITENDEVSEVFDAEIPSFESEKDDVCEDSETAKETEAEDAFAQEEPSENENVEEESSEGMEVIPLVFNQEISEQIETPLPPVDDTVDETPEEASSDEPEPQPESDDEESASEDTPEEGSELSDDESYDESIDDSAEDISSDDPDTSIDDIEDEEEVESGESSEPDDEEYIQDDASFSEEEEEYEDEDEEDDIKVYIPPEKESENTEYADEYDSYEEEDEYYDSPSPVVHTPAKRRNFETRISSELADPSVYSPGVAQDETLFIRKKRPEEATAVFAASTPGLPPEFDDDDFFEQWLEEGDDMIIKDKRQRRRVSAIIGGVTMAFAIIGFIFVIAWFIKGIPTGSNSANSQTDYAKFILPVVNADPEPFETISSVDNNVLVEAAINRLTYGEAANDQTYTALEVENETRLLIPAADVEKSGKVLFGDTFTIDYTVMYAIEDEMIYYYSAADNCFHVVTTSGDIEPEIVKISHIGSRTQVLLEVGYISATEEAMEGSEYYKQMEYVLNALDNGKYYVSAIRAIEK